MCFIILISAPCGACDVLVLLVQWNGTHPGYASKGQLGDTAGKKKNLSSFSILLEQLKLTLNTLVKCFLRYKLLVPGTYC